MIKPEKDPGFGQSYSRHTARVVNPDGSFNVIKKGGRFRLSDAYLNLIEMHWLLMAVIIVIGYVIINTIFALLYLSIGIENLSGPVPFNVVDQFFYCFAFSAQTFTTVGYGAIAPIGVTASLVAAFESLLGLCMFALATGLIYGRFSRPNNRLDFSEQMVVAPFKGETGLMFRFANIRKTTMMEVEVDVIYSTEKHDNQGYKRDYYRLDLEIQKIKFLPLSWTVVHHINEDSPFIGWTKEDYEKNEGEIIILVKNFDESFSSQVYTRHSYTLKDVVLGEQFVRPFEADETGSVIFRLDQLSDTKPVKLP